MSMRPESVQQIKRLMDARGLLHSAVEQYGTALSALQRALDCVDAILRECRDNESLRQISVLRELVQGLPSATHEAFEASRDLTEILAVLASEVTAHEEHVPAGIS